MEITDSAREWCAPSCRRDCRAGCLAERTRVARTTVTPIGTGYLSAVRNLIRRTASTLGPDEAA